MSVWNVYIDETYLDNIQQARIITSFFAIDANESRRVIANFPGFYNSNHTADRFSASRISFMHDFPETRGSQLWFGYFYQ
ncbi:hypothetical protein AYP92_07645 [Lactobacillus crispatus]|uniref:hypothetical protein n=1 Tax=Lactobacillus crispatus TaxID=47770 RepID=UPI000B5DABD1|nr:hypothetical protein [Lactobacillus crispatus]OXC27824.1 hypothetical protein AYP83_03670 [Lactobacillus crispatus]OXC35313.1 hypothetical protein AYP90_09985 [Lactobacillus crispatus]OXC43264.1 hypothetical protein AYP92_07645 [Lactobacillus crispatus]